MAVIFRFKDDNAILAAIKNLKHPLIGSAFTRLKYDTYKINVSFLSNVKFFAYTFIRH